MKITRFACVFTVALLLATASYIMASDTTASYKTLMVKRSCIDVFILVC